MSIVAGGDAPLTYIWKKDGTVVGGNSPTLALTSLAPGYSGGYSVTVTNLTGSAQSATNHLVVLPAAGQDALAMATGPTAYWPLDETTGSVAVDYAGGHNGAYSAGVGLGVPGPFAGDNAVSFSGGNSVSVPYSADLNPAVPFTVEYWIKPSTLAFTCPFSSTDFGVSPRLGWLFYTDISPGGNGYVANGYYFRVYSSAGTIAVASAAGVLSTSWTHVVGVVDGTNIKIYVNGALSGSGAWSGNFTPVTTQPLTMGVRYDSGFAFTGSMDNVAIYSRALTAQEIQTHAQNAPSSLQLTKSGGNVVLTWTPGGGGLQAAHVVTGPYTNVPEATSPWTNTPSAGNTFFRLKY
jgi:hyaluronoglucosaminidase